MSTESPHDVKSAAAVLADDVICQSFIQSSSTLAYACLLIRRKQFDLAVHVLHSLEAKQASRFKDMVFYLQAQIGIETGEFAMVKKRLVPRVHQHPNDMVALALLECSVYHEWLEWAKSRPPEPARSATASSAVQAPAAAAMDPFAPKPGVPPLSNSLFGNQEAAILAAAASGMAAHDASAAGLIDVRPVSAIPAPARPPAGATPVPASRSVPAAAPVRPQAALSAAEGDIGIYQTLANDQNTQAMMVWNAEKGKLKTSLRNPELETLAGLLPGEIPASVQAACTSLDGGSIHKVCFSFQNLTVSTFHAGAESLALITGPIHQSLLTIVRAENTFRKQAASLAQTHRHAEYAPNE